jgi:geranylgeranyl pyrophosphate synthase
MKYLNLDDYCLTEDLDSTSLPEAAALLNRQTLIGGKKFRPALCFLLSEIFSIPHEQMKIYAVAAERIHNATLIHDDIIDETPKRRGKATLNASGFNRRAVLAGDLLLVRALKDVGLAGDLKILRDLNETLVELVEGEWLQLESRGMVDRDESHLRQVAIKKTSSLIAWCCTVAAHLAGLSEKNQSPLKDFGHHVGLAFQMIDDCLDFSTSSGKPFSQDLFEGQINFVTQELLKNRPPLKKQMAEAMRKRLSPASSPWSELELKTACDHVAQKARFEIKIGMEKMKILLKENMIAQKNWSLLENFVQVMTEQAG